MKPISADYSTSLTTWLIFALSLAGMVYLLYHSRIVRRPGYSIPMFFGVFLVLLGVLFTIEHWPFSTALLTAGALLLGLPYALWFARQQHPAGWLPQLKLGWLLVTSLALIWFAFRLPFWKELNGLARALFWAVLLLQIYQRHIRRQ